jgi:hypothetical protein
MKKLRLAASVLHAVSVACLQILEEPGSEAEEQAWSASGHGLWDGNRDGLAIPVSLSALPEGLDDPARLSGLALIDWQVAQGIATRTPPRQHIGLLGGQGANGGHAWREGFGFPRLIASAPSGGLTGLAGSSKVSP